MSDQKTHFRKAFDSPYLSSADLTGPVALTIDRVSLDPDRTKKTKLKYNTAYFVEKELRPGQPLKPMILNATNSKTLARITGKPHLEEWGGTTIRVYVEKGVQFGKETTEGLRIEQRAVAKKELKPADARQWENAKNAYRRDGNLDSVLAKVDISDEHQAQLIAECTAAAA